MKNTSHNNKNHTHVTTEGSRDHHDVQHDGHHYESVNCTLAIILNVFTIIVCTIAIICAYRKKKRKSFEILLINLLAQNIVYLVTVIISCYSWPQFVMELLVAIHILSSFLQTGDLFLLTVQRLLIVRFPIKANIWITKERTKRLVIGEYLVMFILFGAFILLQFGNNPPLVINSNFTIRILRALFGGIVLILNILLVLNVLGVQESLEQQCNIKRKNRNRKTVILLSVMCLSYAISQYLPAIGNLVKDDETVKFIYQYFLWVDALGNGLSYLFLQTKFLSIIEKRICYYGKRVNSESGSEP